MGDADRANVGDEVGYSFDVSNNGTATMSAIKISDTMVRTCRSAVSIGWRDGWYMNEVELGNVPGAFSLQEQYLLFLGI